MDFLQSIFDGLSDFFNSILSVIKQVLPYVLLGCAVWLAFSGLPISLGALGSIPAGASAALAMAGASFLFAPEETAAILTNAASAIGDVASVIVSEATSLVGTAVGGLFSSPAMLALLGFGAFYLLSGRSKQDTPVQVSAQKAAVQNE